jgi:hypothetical protein
MRKKRQEMVMKAAVAIVWGLLIVYCGNVLFRASAQTPSLTPAQRQQQGQLDAVVRAQEPIPIQTKRPEQHKTAHDRSDVFDELRAESSSPAFRDQPGQGKVSGVDFYRDPLNSSHPYESPDAIMQRLSAQKPDVMAIQRKLLESRYDLQAHPDPQAKMSRGKPLAVGPTARLKGVTCRQIGEMAPDVSCGVSRYTPDPRGNLLRRRVRWSCNVSISEIHYLQQRPRVSNDATLEIHLPMVACTAGVKFFPQPITLSTGQQLPELSNVSRTRGATSLRRISARSLRRNGASYDVSE